jgi:hypothetical protein
MFVVICNFCSIVFDSYLFHFCSMLCVCCVTWYALHVYAYHIYLVATGLKGSLLKIAGYFSRDIIVLIKRL